MVIEVQVERLITSYSCVLDDVENLSTHADVFGGNRYIWDCTLPVKVKRRFLFGKAESGHGNSLQLGGVVKALFPSCSSSHRVSRIRVIIELAGRKRAVIQAVIVGLVHKIIKTLCSQEALVSTRGCENPSCLAHKREDGGEITHYNGL